MIECLLLACFALSSVVLLMVDIYASLFAARALTLVGSGNSMVYILLSLIFLGLVGAITRAWLSVAAGAGVVLFLGGVRFGVWLCNRYDWGH